MNVETSKGIRFAVYSQMAQGESGLASGLSTFLSACDYFLIVKMIKI